MLESFSIFADASLTTISFWGIHSVIIFRALK